MHRKVRVTVLGLLCLISPISHAHVDGVHNMSLLDGLLHFITQPSHLVWVILPALFVLLYRFCRTHPRLYKSARIRKTREE